MFSKSEKNTLLGLGYAIWGSVVSLPILGVVFAVIATSYFCIALYHTFKEN